MLVRTPSPKPSESLLGYVLRVSEANGYDTPWHVLSYAGFVQGEMQTAGFPIEKIAPVLGVTTDTLAPVSYVGTTSSGKREFRLLGHSLGSGLRYDPLRLPKPSFCPHCVEELGYIDAFFDLTLAVACPIHRCTLVTECPTCGNPATWYRPGLLTCKCGASYQDTRTEPVSPELTDLMTLLWAKVHGEDVNPDEIQTNMPTAHLLAMPLRSLLLKLPELGRMSCSASNLVADSAVTISNAAADTLANWPNGFRQFLSRLSTAKDETQSAIGYRKQFEHLYQVLFKSRTAGSDFGWLREEFVRYGMDEYGGAVVDAKLLRGEQPVRRFVTKAELARKLNISPTTLRKWGEKDLIDLKVVPTGNQKRYIADLAAYDTVATTTVDSPVLQAREAAAYLGVPVRVLQRLKEIGRLPGQRLTHLKAGYLTADLDGLRAELLAKSPVIAATDAAVVSGGAKLVDLDRVLRKGLFHDVVHKTDFVVAYLNGGIIAVGRTGDTLADILYRKADVAAFSDASRAAVAGGAISQREAAVLLGCDVRGLPGLISAGYLCPVVGDVSIRVTRESVDKFAEQYAALSAIATEFGTSSKRLLRLAELEKLPLLLAASTHAGPTPFIERQYIGNLRRFSEAFPARRPREDDEPKAVKAMRLYLEGLKASGVSLPRCGHKLHRSAIAAAAGVDRSVFYANAEVATMIEEYTRME